VQQRLRGMGSLRSRRPAPCDRAGARSLAAGTGVPVTVSTSRAAWLDVDGEGDDTAAEDHVGLIHTHLSRPPGGGHGAVPCGAWTDGARCSPFQRFL